MIAALALLGAIALSLSAGPVHASAVDRGALLSAGPVARLSQPATAKALKAAGLPSPRARYGIFAVRLRYRTVGVDGTPTTATALVVLPRNARPRLVPVAYAQPAARIVRLTRADLRVTVDAVEVRLAENMVALPIQLRDVAELLLEHSSPGGWLFAGQKAGQPMHPAHLARRLRALGIPVAQARPSALAALAHRIPAPVLADPLGCGAQTICNAGADLKVDYARYVAPRT